MLRDIFKGIASVIRGHVNVLILQWLKCGKIKSQYSSCSPFFDMNYMVTVEVVSSGKHLFVLVRHYSLCLSLSLTSVGSHKQTHTSLHNVPFNMGTTYYQQ